MDTEYTPISTIISESKEEYMPRWHEILKTLKSNPLLLKSLETLKHLGKVSESPAGFSAIAAIGLIAVIYINISNSSPLNQDDVSNINEVHHEQPATPLPTELHNPANAEITPPHETFQLRRRETLSALLKRAKIQTSNAHRTINALKDVTNLRKLKAGQPIRLIRHETDSKIIAELRIRDTFAEEAVAVLSNGVYTAKRDKVTTYPLTQFVEGEITDSLYLSAQRAGMPNKVIVDLIRLMSFDIDFEREIRVGDHFEVYFERSYAPSFNDIENGRILTAKLNLRKRSMDAFFFKDKKGNEGYFDINGKSTRRALMKTPLDVAVITSSYGRRKHPVLGYTRMHKGADFRAPTGTPIMAAGDGVIEKASRYGSYGKYVRIRHNRTYKTAYAHMSRYGKGIKKGKRVKQGQIIGYSGSTGRVSGPHLHYEVLVNGKQTNPMTLKLPTGRTLSAENLEAFQQHTGQLLADIDHIKTIQSTLLAQQNTQTSDIGDTRAR